MVFKERIWQSMNIRMDIYRRTGRRLRDEENIGK